MNEFRYCKDCKFYCGFIHAICTHPELRKSEPVHGTVFCEFKRQYGEKCGPDANLFEPRASKVGFIKRLFA